MHAEPSAHGRCASPSSEADRAAFTAKYLRQQRLQVTILDRWPTPLAVRFGVAPDHPEVKSVQDDFEEVAMSERFSYAGTSSSGIPLMPPT